MKKTNYIALALAIALNSSTAYAGNEDFFLPMTLLSIMGAHHPELPLAEPAPATQQPAPLPAAIEEDPIPTLLQTAATHTATGNHPLAAATHRMAAEVFGLRGAAHREAGQFLEAAIQFRYMGMGWTATATAYGLAGDDYADKATMARERAVLALMDTATAHLRAAQTAEESDNNLAAAENYIHAARDWHRVADTHRDAGRAQDAIDTRERAVDAYHHADTAFTKAEDHVAAADAQMLAAQASIEIADVHAAIEGNLELVAAARLRAAEDFNLAAAAFATAEEFELSADARRDAAITYRDLGDAYVAAGRFQDAVETYTLACTFYDLTANICIETGDNDAAAAAISDAADVLQKRTAAAAQQAAIEAPQPPIPVGAPMDESD